MSDHSNPAAFPSVCLDDPGHPASVSGMGLRDWFAGQAIVAMLGSAPSEAVQDICSGVRGGRPMAFGAYAIADAMLIARQKVSS